jgi:MFS family permease
VAETPIFAEQNKAGVSKAPALEAIRHCWPDMVRVMCVALMNTVATVATIFGAAYAVQPAYGIGFHSDVYLWIPVLGNTVAVLLIPLVGNLSDRIGRRVPIMVGALGSGLLSYVYLYAISVHNVPLAIVISIMMWGVVYQGYNAIFPSFYPELFPARTRVSAVAIAQNIGTMLTALMPAVFAIVAPPGSNVPLIVGSLTLGVTIIAAVAAWTARETYRLRLEDLGRKDALPIPAAEYERIRLEALAVRR